MRRGTGDSGPQDEAERNPGNGRVNARLENEIPRGQRHNHEPDVAQNDNRLEATADAAQHPECKHTDDGCQECSNVGASGEEEGDDGDGDEVVEDGQRE